MAINTEREFQRLAKQSFIIAAIYLLLLFPILHNAYKYLYEQQVWKKFYVLSFYVAALALIVFRSSSFLYLGVCDVQRDPPQTTFNDFAVSIGEFCIFTIYFFVTISQFEDIIIINEHIHVNSGWDKAEASALKERKLRIVKLATYFFFALALVGLGAIWLVTMVNPASYNAVSSGIFSAYFFVIFVLMILNTVFMNRVMRHEYFKDQSHRVRYILE